MNPATYGALKPGQQTGCPREFLSGMRTRLVLPPAFPVKRGSIVHQALMSASTARPRIGVVVCNCEHLDDFGSGAYDGPEWQVIVLPLLVSAKRSAPG